MAPRPALPRPGRRSLAAAALAAAAVTGALLGAAGPGSADGSPGPVARVVDLTGPGEQDRDGALAASRSAQRQAAAEEQVKQQELAAHVEDVGAQLAEQQRLAAEEAAAQAAAAAAEAQRLAQEQAARAAVEAALADPRATARALAAERGWGEDQFGCLDRLWTRESGWRWDADNPTSSAYGIPQALPGHKMSSAGGDWATNPVTQITWGLGYVQDVYGTPCGAWAKSQSSGWY